MRREGYIIEEIVEYSSMSDSFDQVLRGTRRKESKYETGIHTEQGEDRCIVSIEQNGEPKKFFTNSEEMKNILAQISEMPDGFPFETTIRTETFGKGRTKYVFS